MTSRILTCKASDSELFTIDENSAQKSVLLKGLFEDYEETKDTPVEIADISGPILKKAFEYLEHYKESDPKEIPRPLPSANMTEVCGEWDVKFLSELELDSIFDVINAANYLDIKSLLDLSCAKIASEMKGKTAEEIRTKFNIENDLSEAEMKEYEEYQI